MLLVDGDPRQGYVSAKLTEVSNVKCEKAAGAGDVPAWINGHLLLQTCGGFGEFEAVDTQHLTHFLDCIGSVAAYSLSGGEAQFTSQYYDTKAYSTWKDAGYDMRRSKVAWDTSFSPIDPTAYANNRDRYADKVRFNPNSDFWRVGKTIVAVSEVPQALKLGNTDAGVVTADDYNVQFQFGDDRETNLGMPTGTTFINNLPHAARDADGFLWSAVMAFVPRTPYNNQLSFDA